MDGLSDYIAQGCVPGGTARNFNACREHASSFTPRDQTIFCDPQTSGGLLVAVAPHATEAVEKLLIAAGLPHQSIGTLEPSAGNLCQVRLTD